LLVSCRNWCGFAPFLRRTPMASIASFSRLEKAGCLSMLLRKWISSVPTNHPASRSTVLRTKNEDFLGRARKFSFSKVMYTHDKRDKGMKVNSGSTTGSSDSASEGDHRVTSDSAEDNIKTQPVSDADIDKELLRYDYEEFELMPDEEVSIVQPVKESIPIERKSK